MSDDERWTCERGHSVPADKECSICAALESAAEKARDGK